MKHWITRPNAIKFILATLAFYLLLSFNVFHVGEIISPESKDYLSTGNQSQIHIQTSGEQYIQEAIDEIQSQPNHGAATDQVDASKTKFQTVCDSNTTLCKKVNFEGTFTSKEKFLYISSIFKVAQFIDAYIVTKQAADNVLRDVAINKTSGRRGYATHDTVVLNIGTVSSAKEFLELVTHEMGHILDLGVVQGSSDTKDSVFTEFGRAVFGIDDISLLFYALSRDSENTRKSTAGQKDFCSGYGMSDPFEDLAECFNLYTHHNDLFKKFALANKMMKKKYNFIAALFGGTYISKGVDTMKADTRPRDTTKIN